MAASLAVAVVMLVGKLSAYALTGSTAIYADALESITHLGATAMATFALWWAAQPADEDHPYGHGKVAYFSAGFEGAMILAAAIAIFVACARVFVVGPQVEQLGVGLAITLALAGINLVLGLALVRIGRESHALVLVANGQNVLTDVWTSLGVVVGVLGVWATGWLWLDPVIAMILAVNIVYTAFRLLQTSFNGLMDHAHPADAERIQTCLAASVAAGDLASFHQVRHRRVNDILLVEAHLLFPDEMTLHEAHDGATLIERRIGALFPGERVLVTSHLEPESHDDTHPEGHADAVGTWD